MDQLQTQAGSPPVTKTPIAFGDFSQYVTRRRAMTIVRLPERFADAFQIGLLGWWRVDGALLQPSAIKTMNTVY
jgi:HK97 family phage major capsid protein